LFRQGSAIDTITEQPVTSAGIAQLANDLHRLLWIVQAQLVNEPIKRPD
jgi:hypothetical protein